MGMERNGIAIHPDPHHPSVIKSDNGRSISIRRNMPFVRPLAATEMPKEMRAISDEGTSDGVPEGDYLPEQELYLLNDIEA
ncbi:hypothetical protein AB1N83_001882 [Pleurotus pulmonarius]